jgi:hypothetical protein
MDVPNGATATGQTSHYDLLGVQSNATDAEIRRAYRDKSKLFHPDTTVLPADVALEKFRQLNQAYAVLSNSDQRLRYNRELQLRGKTAAPVESSTSARQPFRFSRSAYLEAQDRPLSSGEIFALFILALTFLCCLLLAVLVGLMRGEIVVEKLQGIQSSEWLTRLAPPSLTAPPSRIPTPQIPTFPAPTLMTPTSSMASPPVAPTIRFSYTPPTP